MASFKDLQIDWSMLPDDSQNWSSADLQLAAELGKTLLERNKELETSLKQHQNVIDDQTQEIEYLRKQTVALREVNDSRLRIYEQLEVSIQDLERANHRLALESSSDKKHLKTLTANIECLELKCEELQGTVDDLNLQFSSYKRCILKPPEPIVITQVVNLRHVEYDEIDSSNLSQSPKKEENKLRKNIETPVENAQKSVQENTPVSVKHDKEKDDPADVNEQLSQLMCQLRESQTSLAKEQKRVTELEDHLASMVQQNQSFEKQLLHIHLKDEESKSIHEELMMLEEVRQGQLCSRCLRTIDSPRTGDNMSCLGDEPEDDDASMLEALINNSTHRSSFSMDIQDIPNKSPQNPYRELIEKYEALLEVQRTQSSRNHKSNNLSLHDEMQMSGTFNNVKDTDEESGHGDSLQPEQQNKKSISRTPTDFSEAETSSSGFSDETSNKATQTDDRPGSFLCTIADGEDCKFSIYDDASPVDSRFRNRPEYRELFSEIFTVLKKAAENKDDGMELPLLDDFSIIKNVPNVPPVTPANENLPDFPDNFTDDTQSVLSSTMSEISTNQVDTTIVTENIENKETESADKKNDEPVLTPYVRQPLEYLQVSVNVRKRSSSRRKKQLAERSGSPATPMLGSPKITYSNRQPLGRRRRDIKTPLTEIKNSWAGNTMHFFARSVDSPTPSSKSNRNCCYENNLEYKPSSASQDLSKLKRLELSYAEVLRNADNNKSGREAAARQRRKQ